MTNKSATSTEKHSTATEDLPVLSEQERTELRASLEDAQQRINAGEGVEYDPNMFKQRLIDIYRAAKRERR